MLACLASPAFGQDTPLYDQSPSDLVVLNKANRSAELAVLPLGPEAGEDASGPLRARLVSNPSVEIEITRSSIERIESFPERLLSAAKRHAATREFGSAYDYFARLDSDFPETPGFEEEFASALMLEAATRARKRDYDHALALLETLTERRPGMPGLARAVDKVGDYVLRSRWEEGDFLGVRAAIDTFESQFKALRLTIGERWRERLEGGADEQREKARQLAEQGLTRAALRALTGAKALAPNSLETNNLLQELSAGGRTLWVGVWQTAGESTPPGLDTPAALRQSRLTGGRLGALDSYPQPGAEYRAAIGGIDFGDRKESLTLRFARPAPADAAARLARDLLTPPPGGDAARLLWRQAATVAVEQDNRLTIGLRGPHPNPMGLACQPLPAGLADIAPGDWRRVKPKRGSGADARYERVRGSGAFDAIEEYVYQNVDKAIDALRSRELHLLANVPASKHSTVTSIPGVALGERRVPTLHGLVFGPDTPFRERRELRRALCYAIAREETLSTLITGGERLPGFETLSAPFPRGLTLGDPLRYAYNDSVEPRPYEPRLAALLLTAARSADAQREAGDDGRLDVPSVVTLAHADTPRVRLVVDAIRSQLSAVGLGVQLVPASEPDLAAGRVDYDLRYVELRVVEPLVDCWRLLGPAGITGGCTPAMRGGLERVVGAPIGKEAVAGLKDLHRIAFAEAPMIPLWQTVDHFAYRKSLTGVPGRTVDLYQTVDAWRISEGEGG